MFTCPGCGYRTFSEPPGSYEICRLCGWEDDAVQLLDPWYAGGANRPSLVEWQEWHASETNSDSYEMIARDAGPDDSKDERWRPANEADRAGVRLPRDVRLRDDEGELAEWYYWLRDDM